PNVLFHSGNLEKRQIDGGVSRAVENVPPAGSESSIRWPGEGAGVEPFFAAACKPGERVADLIGCLGGSSTVAHIPTDGCLVTKAALQIHDRVHLPVAQYLAGDALGEAPLAGPCGQLIGRAENGPLPQVEQASSFREPRIIEVAGRFVHL